MSKLAWWLNLLVKILLVDLAICLVVGGWSWLVQDFSPIALSNRFFIGGLLVVLINLASGAGNWGNHTDWRHLLAQSAGQANLTERNSRMIADTLQVYSLALVMIPAGLMAILLAVILGQLR